jgi:hypothetical protein
MSDTPRTKAATRMAFSCEHMVPIEEAQKIERELADALTALAMLGDRHERDLAQSKEANAGLMRACDKLELELLNAKENIGMLEIRHGATMLCHQAQMDEITKQRDELASALKSLCITIISEEPCDITDLLKQSEAALAATKGGSHEKYTNNR